MRKTFTLGVMSRFMSEDELTAFNERYSQNIRRYGSFNGYKPTESDNLAYRAWIRGDMDEKRAAQVMGCSIGTVYARFARLSKQALS